MNMEQNNMPPSTADDKWFFADPADQLLGIESCIYQNGGQVKRATLSDGREARARRLKGKDAKAIRRLTGGDEDKYANAVIALSVTIGGTSIVMEDLDNIWYDDYTILQSMSSINFPSEPKK